MDFAPFAGQTVSLTNDAKAPFPNGMTADPQTTAQVMQFRVGTTVTGGTDGTCNPALAQTAAGACILTGVSTIGQGTGGRAMSRDRLLHSLLVLVVALCFHARAAEQVVVLSAGVTPTTSYDGAFVVSWADSSGSNGVQETVPGCPGRQPAFDQAQNRIEYHVRLRDITGDPDHFSREQSWKGRNGIFSSDLQRGD